MKKIYLLCIMLILVSCSNGENKGRPAEIRETVWEQGKHLSIAINNLKKLDADTVDLLPDVIGQYSGQTDLENITKEETELLNLVKELALEAFYIKILELPSEDYDSLYKKIISYYGESSLTLENYNEEVLLPLFVEAILFKEESDPLNQFMEENSITLTAKDVQYDMPNNLDKLFALSGVAELDDYYNYGFDDFEDSYFSTFVIPDGGSYSDGWYLYFHRDSFKELFNALKSNDVSVVLSAQIPKWVYEKNQGNMAIVKSVQWSKPSS